MTPPASRDAQTVFIVRVTMVGAVLGLLPCLFIVGVAKLIATEYDAGGIAWTVGWPVGFVGTLVVAHLRRRRRSVEVPLSHGKPAPLA